MKTLKFLLLVTFAGIMLFSCKKTEQIITPDDSLCAYIGADSINNAAPIFNEFFDKLNVNLSDSLKIQQFVDWLNMIECVIDAHTGCVSCIHPLDFMVDNRMISEVFISFMENGVLKEQIIDVFMDDTLRFAGIHEDFEPTTILMKTSSYTMEEIFNFLNSFGFPVEEISGTFVSAMSPDNLQYILDRLNEKDYTHRNDSWLVTGYVHYQTQQITIFPHLRNMHLAENQADWLQAMQDYQLSERGGYVIILHVPENTEKEWVERFNEDEFIQWAELNNVVHISF
jgi:hypothetical protein